MHFCYAMTQLMSLPYNYYRCVPAQPSVQTTRLMLRPRTTVCAYRLSLPYKLMSYRDTTYVVWSRTVTQLMLLGHDRTIYVVRNITYDAMSLIATYVRYLCCSTT